MVSHSMTTTEQERERPAAKIERGLNEALEFVKSIKPEDSRPRRKMWGQVVTSASALIAGASSLATSAP